MSVIGGYNGTATPAPTSQLHHPVSLHNQDSFYHHQAAAAAAFYHQQSQHHHYLHHLHHHQAALRLDLAHPLAPEVTNPLSTKKILSASTTTTTHTILTTIFTFTITFKTT
ncbi:hypothetical protein C0J52_01843 [Blattella germanica]|nr:hypothetical protein C0J52_01843 [Blattella germanica]